jgi:septal ring-binding cell division protein DamX
MAKTKSFQLQFTKKQLFFTVMALIVCFLLTFALGAIIGMRYLGDNSDSLIASSVKEEVATPPGTFSSLESRTLEDPEGKKVIHEFTFYDSLPGKAESPMPKAPPQQKKKKTDQATQTKKTDNNRPLTRQPPQPKYTIQFGSFKEEEKANALSNKLSKQGLMAYVSTTKIPNRGTFYRVRMGSFDTQEEAKEWASKLPSLSPPPFITSIK